LKYDERIDNAIINELSKNLSCLYRELKRKIEKRLQKTISFDVYNLHIRKLLKANILGRDHAGKRGKKVLYSIADEAKRQIQLKLIAHPKKSIFRKIYEKFFFYEVHYSPHKVISSEKEFDKLLSELNTTRKKLEWWLWSGAGAETNDIIAREIYGNSGSYRSMSARTRQIHKKEMKTYWLTKGGQSRTLEQINFICSFKQKDLDITMTKIERWEINKYSSNKKLHTKYVYELPGVSIEEFMANEWLSAKFKLADVKEAFNLLQKNHLIEIALTVRNQTRFRITDNVLRNFIQGIRDIHIAEYRFLMYKWQHFDAPSHEEIQRWTLLMSEKVASKFFEKMEIERRTYKKMKEDCKNVQEFIEKLDKDTQLRSRDRWDLSWGFEFDRYEQQRKTKPPTPKAEIEEFEKYRRTRLEYDLEFLPANLEEEGIEELKMMFKDVIERYSFLHNVVRIVCPYVFEPANDELQANIVDDEISKDVGTELLARRLRDINLSDPNVPHKTFHNKITGRKSKIIYLDNYSDKHDEADITYQNFLMNFLNYRNESSFLNYRAFFAVNFFPVNASGLIWANLGFPWIINIM
jgi:hypothetical protein